MPTPSAEEMKKRRESIARELARIDDPIKRAAMEKVYWDCMVPDKACANAFSHRDYFTAGARWALDNREVLEKIRALEAETRALRAGLYSHNYD